MINLTRREALGLLGTTAMLPFSTSCTSAPPIPTDDPAPPVAAGGRATHYMGLAEVARVIESKDVSPVELTQLMLDRIEAVDGRLKSYATVMADHAMAAARDAEDEIRRGQYRGPLHGCRLRSRTCATRDVSERWAPWRS